MIAPSNSPRRLVLARRLAGLLLGAAAVVATVASPAHAWQYQSPSGPVGNVSSPAFRFGDLYVSGSKYFTASSDSGPTVYRSSATAGYQLVTVKYYVERWNGSAWQVVATSDPIPGSIYAGQLGVRMLTGARIQPSITTGYFRVTEGIVWQDATNAILAYTWVGSDTAGEQVCGTVNPNRSCYQYPGYVYVG